MTAPTNIVYEMKGAYRTLARKDTLVRNDRLTIFTHKEGLTDYCTSCRKGRDSLAKEPTDATDGSEKKNRNAIQNMGLSERTCTNDAIAISWEHVT